MDDHRIDGGACACPIAGWCERHRRRKNAREHFLCQSSRRWRRMMDGLVDEAPTPPPRGAAAGLGALGSAAASGLRFVWGGARMTGREIYDERLRLCDDCPQQATTLGVRRCRACGCALAVKAAFPHESCPVGVWPAVGAEAGGGCGGC